MRHSRWRLVPARTATAVVAACMLAAVLGTAGALLAAYWTDPAALWRDPYHDRNTHYLNGLNLSLDLTALDPLAFLVDATADPIWPPLHAIVLALVLAACGPDHRLAILPSLLGWSVAVLLTGLVASRAASRAGPCWVAGAVGVALAMASPAFRLLGSDVMLEGLGAALTMLALYAYLRCADSSTGRRWARTLAIVLTALFFEKFNYWLMVVLGLGATAALGSDGLRAAQAGRADLTRLARRCLLSLPGVLGAGGLTLAAVAAASGPHPITLLGRDYLVLPGPLLTGGYGLLLLGACCFWRRERATLRAALGPAGTLLLRWHVAPVAFWFLIPQAVTRFLFFVGPTHQGASTEYDPWRALQFHWAGFSSGFHTPGLAVLVLALAMLGGLDLMRRGGTRRVLVVFATLSAIALVLHPQQQWRFQATMLPALWACAGVGGAVAVAVVARVVRTPAAVPGLLLIGLVAGLAWHSPAPLAQRVAIRTPDAPSDLLLASAYLPLLDGARHIGVVTTFGVSDLFAWTIREACRCRVAVEQPWVQMAATPSEAADLTAAWLNHLQADRVLFLDAPAPYSLPGQARLSERLAGVAVALAEAPHLEPMVGPPLRVGRATVMAWRVGGEPPVGPPRRHHLYVLMSVICAAWAAALLLLPRRLAHDKPTA